MIIVAVNKVVVNGEAIIDLSADTVTANKLAKGYTAHDKSGAVITGTMDADDVVKYTEQNLTDAQKAQARSNIGAAPAYTYGTTDLTAGSSALETGKLYFVYE